MGGGADGTEPQARQPAAVRGPQRFRRTGADQRASPRGVPGGGEVSRLRLGGRRSERPRRRRAACRRHGSQRRQAVRARLQDGEGPWRLLYGARTDLALPIAEHGRICKGDRRAEGDQLMRNTFANVFYEEAKKDPRLCVVVADISPAGSMEKLRKEYPQRFINTGVAEQIMIGMCAGMAMRGLKPFAYTIATFALFRPYEFVRDDLCYQCLPVTLVGVGGVVTYSTLGGTHHSMEDVAIACAMPGMNVIAPCDPEDGKAAALHCVSQQEGPICLRLGRAGEPVLGSATSAPFQFGKLRMLK